MPYRFLLIDDAVTVVAATKRAIRVAGLSAGPILDAADGFEALDLLATHAVDLILADPAAAGGPDTPAGAADGIGRLLTEPATRAVPVVLTPATPDPEQIRRLLRAGARGWLRKPLTPDALRDMVTRVLEPTHV